MFTIQVIFVSIWHTHPGNSGHIWTMRGRSKSMAHGHYSNIRFSLQQNGNIHFGLKPFGRCFWLDGRTAKENMLKLVDRCKTNFDALCTKLQENMQKYFDDHPDFTGHPLVGCHTQFVHGWWDMVRLKLYPLPSFAGGESMQFLEVLWNTCKLWKVPCMIARFESVSASFARIRGVLQSGAHQIGCLRCQ